MNKKILGLFLLMTFVLTVSISMVSAANFTVSSPVVLTQATGSSGTFTITPTQSTTFSTVMAQILDQSGVNIAPSPPTIGTISTATSFTLNAVLPPTLNVNDLILGRFYSGNLLISDTTDASNNQTVVVGYIKTFCSNGAINASLLSIDVDIDNQGEGDDDQWLPLDRIEIEVDVEANADDLDDVTVELVLIEADTGNDVTNDLRWISKDDEKVDIGNLDDGDDEKHTFIFEVDTELGLDESDYIIMIKTYTDGDEDEICTDSSADLSDNYFEEIEIERESDNDRQVIVYDIEADTIPLICGKEAIISSRIANIGDSGDFEKVKVTLSSSKMGLDTFIVLDDVDEDDAPTKLEFSFIVPDNITEGLYTLEYETFYDWDDDEDPELDISYDEDSEIFSKKFKVEGICLGSTQKSSKITAQLSDDTSKAVTGKQLIIETTVENTGNVDTEYTLSVTGNSLWSEVDAIDPDKFTLAPGATKDVTVYLDIDKDAELGEKEFTIKTTYGSESTEQKVLIDIEEGFGRFAVVDNVKDNWFIYLIILINVILIVAIILAVKGMVARRAVPGA